MTIEAVPKLMLTGAELAAALGISERKIESMLAGGRLPAPLRIDRIRRWRRQEIEAWLAAGMPSQADWQRDRKGLGAQWDGG